MVKDFDMKFTTPSAFYQSKQINTDKIKSFNIKIDFIENPIKMREKDENIDQGNEDY